MWLILRSEIVFGNIFASFQLFDPKFFFHQIKVFPQDWHHFKLVESKNIMGES